MIVSAWKDSERKIRFIINHEMFFFLFFTLIPFLCVCYRVWGGGFWVASLWRDFRGALKDASVICEVMPLITHFRRKFVLAAQRINHLCWSPQYRSPSSPRFPQHSLPYFRRLPKGSHDFLVKSDSKFITLLDIVHNLWKLNTENKPNIRFLWLFFSKFHTDANVRPRFKEW